MSSLSVVYSKLFSVLIASVLVGLTTTTTTTTSNTESVSQLNCDFDSPQNYCKWKPTSVQPSNWKWSHMNVRTVNFTGPLATVDKKGYFIMSYDRNNAGSPAPTATLESPIIDAINNETCFQFYYFIYGVGVDRLVLTEVNITTDEEHEIWSKRNPSGDMWHLTQIHIPSHNSKFMLKFSAYAEGGAIALDNFIGLPNKCSFESVCDFESGFCDWKSLNISNTKYQFNIIMARDEEDQGMMFDHTTQTEFGHLLQARNGQLNDRAVIVKETPSMYSTHCLIFWYYRQKSYKNKLEVLLFGTHNLNISVWNSSLTYPLETWHRAMVTLSPDQYGQFIQIGLSAEHLDPAPIYSPINVDDIELRFGKCPEPISCDFNVDMCGFSNNPTAYGADIWTWDHGYGRVEYASKLNFSYPPIDRTGLSDGMFLYTDFTTLRTFHSFRDMRLDSEYVGPTVASCLTFYYLAMDSTSNSTTFVVNAYDKTGTGKTNVWTYSRSNDTNTNSERKRWIEVNVDIQMKHEFKLSFEVKTNVSNTYIALDDISYRFGKCSSSSTAIPPIQTTTIPVPHKQQVSCDFESGDFCGWKQSANDAWSINDLNNNVYSDLKPSTDHTKHNSDGRYAYVAESRGVLKSSTLTVGDSFVKKTLFVGQSCFSLWFYMRSDSSAKLQVISYDSTQSSGKGVTESVVRTNDWGEKWNLLRFETYQDSDYDNFSITAQVKNGFIGIDDIRISHNPCSLTTDQTLQCNFEEQRYYSCGFGSVSNEGLSQWRLVQGSVLSQKLVDHTFGTTYGHMMAMNTQFNDTMTSQWFPLTQGSCLTFSYLMYGLNNNQSLEFGIIKENTISWNNIPTIWSVSGDMGLKWYTHQFTVVSDMRWRMAFSGRLTTSSKTGIMAIDDINIDFDKPCPPTGKCDFESGDSCLWQNQKPNPANGLSKEEKLGWAQLSVGGTYKSTILDQSDFTWTVHSPNQAHFTQYPLFDHTFGRSNGHYLLLKADASRLSGKRTILMSDRYDIDPKDRTLCLSLYYYFKGNGGSSAQTQLDIYESENISKVTKIAKIITPSKSMQNWMLFNTTVEPMNENSSNLWFYLVGTVINLEPDYPYYPYSSNLAIDDISITTGGCASVDNSFDCSPTEKILKSQVCNKVKDCGNGIDEKVCGSCDFENSFLCGFSIDWNPKNTIEKSLYKWRFGDSSSGPKSGSDHSIGYMIARRLGPIYSQAVGGTDLITPVIKGAQAGCYVTFKYNIQRDKHFSAPKSTLKVILSSENGFEITEIWNSDVLDISYGQWMSGSAFLKRMNYNFKLIFRASDTGLSPDSYVAVDDITFENCDIPQTTSGECEPNTYFACAKGGCISKYFVCDYTDDCGDNSDEIMCSNYVHRTDFERGWALWKSHTLTGWTLSTGSSSLIEGQTRDHTIGTGHGHFAYLSSDYSGHTKTDTLFGSYIPNVQGCRMTLWTDIEGNSSLNIKLMNTKTGVISKQMRKYATNNRFTYDRQIIDLYTEGTTGLCQIYLEGNVSPKKLSNGKQVVSYIAIDDISLSPECQTGVVPTGGPQTPKPPPNPCPPEKPYDCRNSDDPKERVCISMENVCSFTVECPNNNDERDCGSCSFDKHDLCGWHNVGDSRQKWSLHNANQFRDHPVIPNSDSSGNKTGSFIIIDTSQGGLYNTEAIMSTPLLGATSANCKLTFDYHHSSQAREPTQSPILTIKINYPKNNIKKTIGQISKRANTWTKASVHIGSMASGFQIYITAMGSVTDVTQPFADIEIDNIQFTHCESTQFSWDTDINCNFEAGTCGWTDVDLLTNSKLDWVREKSPDVDPGYDHTSKVKPLPPQYGTWIRTRKELGMTGNNSANLMTVGSIDSTKTHCLSFWYHMWGSNLAQFALILNHQQSEFGGKILWIKRRPQSNNWIKESITIQNDTSFYLIFKATLQPPNGRHEDSIGLDDIKWTDGKCPDQLLCDFESDTCGWNSSDKTWRRTIPSLSTNKGLKPRVDHTLGLDSGAYVRLDSVNPKSWSLLTFTFNDWTPLEDSTPFSRKSMCLKFWYYRSTSAPYNNTLDVQISTNHSQNVEVYTVWTINMSPEWGTFNDQWMSGRANLTLVNQDMIRFKGQLKDNQSVIAIDDILLEPHPCEPRGWCDFESDFCGWSNAFPLNSTNILWLRNSGSSTSTLNGPKTDHTTDTLEGWYAFVPSDSQDSGTAVLISEPLSYQVICLKFYYQISSDSNVVSPKLQVLFTTPKGLTQVIANITSNTRNQWIAFNITHQFESVVVYRLKLKTLEGNITQSDVAVDDIQVWSDTCADVAKNSQSLTQSPPLTTQIPQIEKEFDCYFEGKGCLWNTSSSWTISNWTDEKKIGPPVDHTLGTSKGHYLLFNSSKQTAEEKRVGYSQIISNIMEFTENPNCLSFWYYSDSESYFNISVAFMNKSSAEVTPNPLENILLISPTVTSNSWKQLRVQLPVVSNISIAIALVFHNQMVGSFALDDIVLSPGKCQSSGQMCDFSFNYCGFKVNRVSPQVGNQIGFIANEAILKGYKLRGPEWDHTTKSVGNYFLFANQAQDVDTLYRTELVIPNLSSTQYQSKCLKFWYQISGQTSNLQIYVVPLNQYIYYYPQWTVKSALHTHWTLGQLTVRAEYIHKIVFSLSKSKDMNYIALDDISISDGVCEPPVSCDFDIDWCDWYFIDGFNDTNWKWGRLTGAPPDTNWPGPWNDHTLGKQGGFLYMTAYRDTSLTNKIRNAYIESMPVSTNLFNCFSFYAQIIGNNASLQVFAVQFQRGQQNSKTISLQTISKQTQKWTKFNVKIDSNLFSKDVELSIRIKGSLNDSNSFIALDDIWLTSDKECNNVYEDVFDCMDGTQIDSIRVCDFVNQCSQGEDEKDCGDCDFENGMCGWTNTWKVNNQQWIRKNSDNRSLPNGPTVDGEGKPNGYYMIIQKDNIGYERRAQLDNSVDPIHRFKRSHTSCRMYFDYYITGIESTLRIVVKEGPSSYNYVWRASGDSRGWNKNMSVDIGEHRSQFSVEFEGDIRSKERIIAIDDISFKSCGAVINTPGVCSADQIKCPMDSVCINAFSLCDGINDCGTLWDESFTQCSEQLLPKCDFESLTKCPEIFKIESDKGSNSRWFLVNTALFDNLGRKTGPVNDHTFRLMRKGVYLALNGSVDDKNTKSRLISSWIQSSGQKCAIRLFYYMYGSDTQMASLRIYGRTQSQTISDPQPILKTGNLGQQWFRAILPVNSSTPFQFVIEGEVGAGNEADIAIDDISFSSGCHWAHTLGSTTSVTQTSQKQSTNPSVSTSSMSSSSVVTSPSSSKRTTISQKTINPITGTITEKSLTTLTSSTDKTKNKMTSKTTTTSLKSTSTPNPIKHKERDDSKGKRMGPYAMTASICAPIVVLLALILGFIFYKRYQRNKSEDRQPLTPTVINLTERSTSIE